MQEDRSLKSAYQRALQSKQLKANRLAQKAGEPLPYPNAWDKLDPTKLPESASPDEISLRYRAFCELCPPPQRTEYTI